MIYVHSIGMISPQGPGLDRFSEALQHPERAVRPSGDPAILSVDLATVPDKTLLKKMRRADRLSRMAVVAAADALSRASLDPTETSGIGVIVATAFGPHPTTFAFLDDILTYGDAGVSPTTFSHSVHNAAAAYVAQSLGLEGPSLTVTRFFHPFESALELASAWLSEGRCRHVLVGAVEESGAVLQYVLKEKLRPAPEGRIRPFDPDRSGFVAAEGSVFCLLGNEIRPRSLASIESVAHLGQTETPFETDVLLIGADGLLPNESPYYQSLPPSARLASFTPFFGSQMIGTAFHVASAALMFGKRQLFRNPEADNPLGLPLVDAASARKPDRIGCLRLNCHGEKMIVYMRNAEAGAREV